MMLHFVTSLLNSIHFPSDDNTVKAVFLSFYNLIIGTLRNVGDAVRRVSPAPVCPAQILLRYCPCTEQLKTIKYSHVFSSMPLSKQKLRGDF